MSHKTDILNRASFGLGSSGLAKQAVCSASTDGANYTVDGERSQPGQATAQGVARAAPCAPALMGAELWVLERV